MNKKTSGNSLLDISEYYIPLELSEIFGNKNDFVLEIGFGDGDFLIEMAQRHPEKNFLGMEIKKKRFNIAVKKSRSFNNGNLKFLHMNANIAAKEIFLDNVFFSYIYKFS